MRFVCDHDVDAAVAARLRRLGHDAWTAANAGLSAVRDDELTVYADNQSAALLTHDTEFSKRRQRNVVGKHVWLRCSEMDAADLVEEHLDELVEALSVRKDVWVRLSAERLEPLVRMDLNAATPCTCGFGVVSVPPTGPTSWGVLLLTLRCRGRGGCVAQRRYDHEQWARQQFREEQRQQRADLAAQKSAERERKQAAVEAGKAHAEQLNQAAADTLVRLRGGRWCALWPPSSAVRTPAAPW